MPVLWHPLFIGTEPTMDFLRTDGQRIINESGDEVILSGYALGNWMIQEAFLFGTGGFSADFKPFMRAQGMDRGRTIDRIISELAGEEYARSFWPRYHRAFVTADDIRLMADMGMNSVRVPLNARLFLKEGPGYRWNEESFSILANLLAWCEQAGIYAILDLHAAVGGQSTIGCDDEWDNQPHLFTDRESWERTCVLWEEFARRYGNLACVAGYELLNEPLALPAFDRLDGELLRFYDECIGRIRAIDRRHIIFLQGHRFAHRSDLLRPDMDPVAHNWCLAMHIYETLPDLGLIGPILAERERLGVPVWVGESGGAAAWGTVLYEMLRQYHIGTNVWVYKAVWRPNAPTLVTYEVPDGFDEIVRYANEGGPRPGFERSARIFDAYIDKTRLVNCAIHEEEARAMLRGAGAVVPAIGYDAVPGRGKSFEGSYPYCAYCGYRREDPMEFVLDEGVAPYDVEFAKLAGVPKYGDYPRLSLRLHEGDFACYTFRGLPTGATLSVSARSSRNGTLGVEVCKQAASFEVDGIEWTSFQAPVTSSGDVVVKLSCARGTVDVKSLCIR